MKWKRGRSFISHKSQQPRTARRFSIYCICELCLVLVCVCVSECWRDCWIVKLMFFNLPSKRSHFKYLHGNFSRRSKQLFELITRNAKWDEDEVLGRYIVHGWCCHFRFAIISRAMCIQRASLLIWHPYLMELKNAIIINNLHAYWIWFVRVLLAARSTNYYLKISSEPTIHTKMWIIDATHSPFISYLWLNFIIFNLSIVWFGFLFSTLVPIRKKFLFRCNCLHYKCAVNL